MVPGLSPSPLSKVQSDQPDQPHQPCITKTTTFLRSALPSHGMGELPSHVYLVRSGDRACFGIEPYMDERINIR